MTSKTLAQYQKETKNLDKKFNFNWSLYVRYIHLIEELGELGEALTVAQGDRESGSGKSALADHTDVKEELGDVFFGVLDLANQLNVDMDEVAENMVQRYEGKLKRLKTRRK